MGNDLQKGDTFVDGESVTGARLNALVDSALAKSTIISARSLKTPLTGACEFMINDAGTLKKGNMTDVIALVLGGVSGTIHGKAAITTLQDLDEFLVWDDTPAAERKITYASLKADLEGSLDFPDVLAGATVLTGTATVNPGIMTPDDGETFTITVTGASTTNTPAVFLGFSIAYPDHVVVASARVSSANTVTVILRNVSEAASIDIASHTVRAVVFQF